MTSERRLRIHPAIRERAQEFRHPLTRAENFLWQVLRDRKLNGLKIRRQEPFGPYIADFYCHEARVIIEVDGPSHDRSAEYDAIRTAWFEGLEIKVIRFTNQAIFNNIGEVLQEIAEVCESKRKAG
jgi:very-short-patch-repair endonuclease